MALGLYKRFEIRMVINVRRDQELNLEQLLLRKRDILDIEGEGKELVHLIHTERRFLMTAGESDEEVFLRYYDIDNGKVALNPKRVVGYKKKTSPYEIFHEYLLEGGLLN